MALRLKLAALFLCCLPTFIAAHHPTAVYAFAGVTRCSSLPPERERDYRSTLTREQRSLCGFAEISEEEDTSKPEEVDTGYVAYRLWAALNPERAATITSAFGDAEHPISLPPALRATSTRNADAGDLASSWLTVGLSDNTDAVSSSGITLAQWTPTRGLSSEGGPIEVRRSDGGAAPPSSGEAIILANVLVPLDAVLGQPFVATLSLRGRKVADAESAEEETAGAIWEEHLMQFTLEAIVAPYGGWSSECQDDAFAGTRCYSVAGACYRPPCQCCGHRHVEEAAGLCANVPCNRCCEDPHRAQHYVKRPEYDGLLAWYEQTHGAPAATPPPTAPPETAAPSATDVPSTAPSDAPTRAPSTRKPTAAPTSWPTQWPSPAITAAPSSPSPPPFQDSGKLPAGLQEEEEDGDAEEAEEEETGGSPKQGYDAAVLAAGAVLILAAGVTTRHLCLRSVPSSKQDERRARVRAALNARVPSRAVDVAPSTSFYVDGFSPAHHLVSHARENPLLPVTAGPAQPGGGMMQLQRWQQHEHRKQRMAAALSALR